MDTHMRQSVKSTYPAASSRLPNKQAITKKKRRRSPRQSFLSEPYPSKALCLLPGNLAPKEGLKENYC